jgi:hypothetical protein
MATGQSTPFAQRSLRACGTGFTSGRVFVFFLRGGANVVVPADLLLDFICHDREAAIGFASKGSCKAQTPIFNVGDSNVCRDKSCHLAVEQL